MPHSLGFDALAPEFRRYCVKPGREYAEPTAQKIDSSLRFGRTAPHQRNGNAENAQYSLRFPNMLPTQPHCLALPIRFLLVPNNRGHIVDRLPGQGIICAVVA